MLRTDMHQHITRWRTRAASWPSTHIEQSPSSLSTERLESSMLHSHPKLHHAQSVTIGPSESCPPSTHDVSDISSRVDEFSATDNHTQCKSEKQSTKLESISTQEPLEPVFASMIETWMSARTQISSIRDVILVTRTKVKKEKLQCHLQEELFLSLLDELIDHLDHDCIQQSVQPIIRLSNDLRKCRNEIKGLWEKAVTLEDLLSRYEYELQLLEDRIYHDLDHDFQGIAKETQKKQLQIQSKDEDSKSEELHYLQHRLYLRMGDFRIHLDRLNDFEHDLIKELDERELLRAKAPGNVSNDAQFFEEAKRKRDKIQNDFDLAKREVQELKLQCLQQGIPFDEPDDVQSLHYSGTESFMTASGPLHPFPPPETGTSSIVGAFFSAQERVARWLKEGKCSPHSGSTSFDEEEVSPNEQGHSSLKKGWVVTNPISEEPQWLSGPPPCTGELEALLRESAASPLGGHEPSSDIDACSGNRHLTA